MNNDMCPVIQHACNRIEAVGFQSTEISGKGDDVFTYEKVK